MYTTTIVSLNMALLHIRGSIMHNKYAFLHVIAFPFPQLQQYYQKLFFIKQQVQTWGGGPRKCFANNCIFRCQCSHAGLHHNLTQHNNKLFKRKLLLYCRIIPAFEGSSNFHILDLKLIRGFLNMSLLPILLLLCPPYAK